MGLDVGDGATPGVGVVVGADVSASVQDISPNIRTKKIRTVKNSLFTALSPLCSKTVLGRAHLLNERSRNL